MSSMDDKERLLQEETDTVDEETFMAAKPDQRRWRCFGRLYFVSLHVLLVVLLVAVVRIGGLSQCPAEVNVVSNCMIFWSVMMGSTDIFKLPHCRPSNLRESKSTQ